MKAPFDLNMNGVFVATFATLEDGETAYQLLRENLVKDHQETQSFRPVQADGSLLIDPDEYPHTNALLVRLLHTFRGLRSGAVPRPISWGSLEELPEKHAL